jgi:hypothetical protein
MQFFITASISSLLVSLLVALSACGDNAVGTVEAPNTRDSESLVEFYLPPGWSLLSGSQKSRFVPEGAQRENAMLYVIPRERYSGEVTDTVWQNTKAKHEIQGHQLVSEESSETNGFAIREAVYEAERNGQALIYHDYFIFSEDLQIEASLYATQQAHQHYAPEFETLTRSIRPLAQSAN